MKDAIIIQRLGGASVLARIFNTTRQAVHKWGISGIPNGRRSRLAKLAALQGLELPKQFHMPKPDRRAK